MMVLAPSSGVSANFLAVLTTNDPKPPLASPKRVATNPGCRQFAVTPLPSRRRASSRVNRMFISLERPYMAKPL